MNSTVKGYLAGISQSIIIGFSFIFVIKASKYVDTWGLLSYRFFITAGIVIIYRMLNPSKFNLSIDDWKRLAPYSLIYPFIFFMTQTIGLSVTASSEAGIVYGLSPILIFLIAKVALGEKASKKQILFIFISIFGVAYINVMKGIGSSSIDSSSLGLLFIFISVLSYSVYNVLIRGLGGRYTAMEITYVINTYAFVFFLIIHLILYSVRGELNTIFNPLYNVEFIFSILYLGIFSSFASTLLSSIALSNIDATTVGLFQNITTVITVSAGVFIMNEKLMSYHIIGVVIILFGTIGFNLSKKDLIK